MWVLEAILLVVLPYGTAIICGAITEGAGRLVSGYCSLGGLALGIYFFSKCMEVLRGGRPSSWACRSAIDACVLDALGALGLFVRRRFPGLPFTPRRCTSPPGG